MPKSIPSPCKAKNPSTCRYHAPSAQVELLDAVLNKDAVAYKKARERLEQENNPAVVEAEEFVHGEKFRNVKKMPALFEIDRLAHKATTVINEKAAWIFNEPARATIKRDGTSITVNEDGTVFARRAVKKGKTAPNGFIPAETDSFTGSTFGLEPVTQSGFHKMFQQASQGRFLPPGTYELCGPKINGNPESLSEPVLFSHGSDDAIEIPDMSTMPREEAYETLKTIFADYKARGIEGVVWAGANGKRTKLRVKDFFGDENRNR